MRLNRLCRTQSKLAWLAVVALLIGASPVWSADDDKENLDDVRYELIKNGKELLRFDKKTGELARMEKNDDGSISWILIPVRKSNAVATKPKTENKGAPTIGPDEHAQGRPEAQKKKIAAPDLFGPNGEKLEEDFITDYDRRASLGAIASYEKSLSVCHTVQIGDRIAGTFLIKNKGDKKLKTLELTMLVPVVGREKPEEHRFLFVDKEGSTNPPPQPAPAGKEPEALLQKVDIPCPAGHAKGSADLKITYLKFAE